MKASVKVFEDADCTGIWKLDNAQSYVEIMLRGGANTCKWCSEVEVFPKE